MPDGLNSIHERLTAAELKVNQIEEEVRKNKETAKGDHHKLEKRVDKVENRVEWQEREVNGIKKSIDSIQEDTKWLRRTITTALIGTLSTGVIGGAIALIYNVIGAGGG